MRRLLLAVMILLLPLRGLMGDAMAMSMLVMPAHESTPAAATASMPCPDHADPSDQASSGSSEHSHTACDLCNGPAMSLSSPGHPWLPTVHGVNAGPVERFASSEPQRGIKPPIS
jgi:hypothetical protein